MDRYVDFNVQVMAREPIDILANPTFLPICIEDQYDALWTPARMSQVIETAVRYGVAIEINARYRIPSLTFLRMAKEAGVRFSFGSNHHGEDIGRMGYCLEMARRARPDQTGHFYTPAARAPSRSKHWRTRCVAVELRGGCDERPRAIPGHHELPTARPRPLGRDGLLARDDRGLAQAGHAPGRPPGRLFWL